MWARRKLLAPARDNPERQRMRTQATQEVARKRADEQVTRTLEYDHDEARERLRAAPRIQSQLSAGYGQLQRVRHERQRARTEGEERRAAMLGVREQRIEAEIARGQVALNDARRIAAYGKRAQRTTGSLHTREQREQRSRLLDEQAELPAAGRRAPDGRRRDYAAVASLAGHGREQYERLDPRRQREARLRIDRELELRSRLDGAARDVAHDGAPRPGLRERRIVERELDRALEQRMRDDGYAPPSARTESSTCPSPSELDTHLRRSPHARGGIGSKSSVMDDAREVAARRKRQLGGQRPR
jgi:hypothetical protein